MKWAGTKSRKTRRPHLCELLDSQVVLIVIVGCERFISRLKQYHAVCADDGHDEFCHSTVTIVGSMIKRMKTLNGTLERIISATGLLFEA